MTVGLFFLTIAFLMVGFAILPFWNAVFAVMAAFLGSLWMVSHGIDGSVRFVYADRMQKQALDKALEGIHEAEQLGNVYLRNLFYGVSLAVIGLSDRRDGKAYLAKLYEAKYNEPLPIPVYPSRS